MEKKRLDYVDVCKAFGILLVVLGHTYFGPDKLYKVINSFHMPLFFILSGFTYNLEKNSALGFWGFVRKKAKQLLIPYAAFAFANLLIQILWKTIYLKEAIGWEYITDNIKGIVFCYSDMLHMPNCTPVWFLLCLFISNILFFLLLYARGKLRISLALICMLISYAFSFFTKGYTFYPWKFPVFLMGVFLMYVGYKFRSVITIIDKIKKPFIILICITILIGSAAVVIITGHSAGMNDNQYGNLLVFLGTAVSSSVALLMFCMNIKIFGMCKPLLWFGRNTLYVVGFNYLCRDIAIEVYYFVPIFKEQIGRFIMLFIITTIFCSITIWVCNC